MPLQNANYPLIFYCVDRLGDVFPAKHVEHLNFGGTALPIHHVKHADRDWPVRSVEFGHWPDGVVLGVGVGAGWSTASRASFDQVSIDDFSHLTDKDRSKYNFDVFCRRRWFLLFWGAFFVRLSFFLRWSLLGKDGDDHLRLLAQAEGRQRLVLADLFNRSRLLGHLLVHLHVFLPVLRLSCLRLLFSFVSFEISELGEDDVSRFARDEDDEVLLDLLNFVHNEQFVRHHRRDRHQRVDPLLGYQLVALVRRVVGEDTHLHLGVNRQNVLLRDSHQGRQRRFKLVQLFHLTIGKQLEDALVSEHQVLVKQVRKAARLLDLEQDLPCDVSMRYLLVRRLLRDFPQAVELDDSSFEGAAQDDGGVGTFTQQAVEFVLSLVDPLDLEQPFDLHLSDRGHLALLVCLWRASLFVRRSVRLELQPAEDVQESRDRLRVVLHLKEQLVFILVDHA